MANGIQVDVPASKTPYCLRFSAFVTLEAENGIFTSLDITQAALVAAAAAGPLKEWLKRTYTATEWKQLQGIDMTGAPVDNVNTISAFTESVNDNVAMAAEYLQSVGVNLIRLKARLIDVASDVGGGSVSAILEIRFNHSAGR